MFSMIAVSGMQLVFKQEMSARNSIILAVALGLGFGLGSVPDALQHLPNLVKLIFSQSGLVVSFIVAAVMNLVLPKENLEENIKFSIDKEELAN